MEQHPVPQHIAAYEFHLVGDMTLKQFIQLASGVIVAWLIYSSPINPIIKWPMMIFSSCLGAALAFLPLEERTLDAWILNFFKAIYSPTLFLWQKKGTLPEFLQEKPIEIKKTPIHPRKQREQLTEYLKTLTYPPEVSPLDEKEEERVTVINQLFASIKPPPSPETRPPKPEVTPESLKVETPLPPEPLAEEEEPLEGSVVLPAPTIAPPMKVESYKKEKSRKKALPPPPPAIPPPQPEIANVIVGIVVDKEERIIPDAIIEIKDKNKNPVRALKTNKLGQFFIATPLVNGPYEIEIEKEPFQFDIIDFEAKGEIIPPVKIVAKRVDVQKSEEKVNS